MVGEKRGITATLHGIIVLLWVFLSVIIYGSIVLVLGPFGTRLPRMVQLWWNRHFLRVAGVAIKVHGAGKLDPAKRYVFISNHQSHIDIPVLFASMKRQLSFIAKKELFTIPFFGWGMYVVGHIWIDRSNARKAHVSIQRAIQRLRKDNISLVLFPEGTRSADGTIGQFKQGSFLLALQAGVEVVPLAIHNSSHLLPKHALFIKKGTVQLTICDPIAIDASMTKADISSRVHDIIEKTLVATGI